MRPPTRFAGAETAIRLSRQPMDLLLLLLERRQELVSREDIAKRLWSPDVFTDLDAGIHTAILKIRQVLGDSRGVASIRRDRAREGLSVRRASGGHAPRRSVKPRMSAGGIERLPDRPSSQSASRAHELCRASDRELLELPGFSRRRDSCR